MKNSKILKILALLLAVLIVLAIIVGVILKNISESPSETVSSVGAMYQAEVNDMDVVYYVLSENGLEQARVSYPDHIVFEKGYSHDTFPHVYMCRIVVTEEYLASENPAQGVLGSLARCYGEMVLGFPTEDVSNDEIFINRWVNAYREVCNGSLESLGFPLGDVDCEYYPTFEEIFLEI